VFNLYRKAGRFLCPTILQHHREDDMSEMNEKQQKEFVKGRCQNPEEGVTKKQRDKLNEKEETKEMSMNRDKMWEIETNEGKEENIRDWKK
jgi:hypothetical protein